MSAEKLVFSILFAAAFCHFLNDMVQSLIPAIYPLLKASFHLDFSQIGLITLTYQITASLLQPLIGHFNDRHPRPYSLAIGMGFTLVGLVTLSGASTYRMLLLGAAWWAWVRRCFTPSLPAWCAWSRADSTVSPKHFFK